MLHEYIKGCYKFPTESNSERILKIGQYLVKLRARVRCFVFLTHSIVRARKELRESVQAFARFKYEDSGSTVVYPRYFHFMFLSVILVETK